MTGHRATRLGVDQVRAVDHFAELLFVMFPHQLGVAHVGSSIGRPRYIWRGAGRLGNAARELRARIGDQS
jgi:hypothetical protein